MSTNTRVAGCFPPGAKFSRSSATWATKRFRPPARRTENPRSHLYIPDQSARPQGHACSGLDFFDLGLDKQAKTTRSPWSNVPPSPLLLLRRLPAHRLGPLTATVKLPIVNTI